MRRLWLLPLLLLAIAAPARAASPFADWAAVVVAGDARGSRGGPTEAFDNARRDVAGQLVGMGFAPANLSQFSTRPQRYKDVRALKSEPQVIFTEMQRLTGAARGGGLVYFTSHGAPQGVVTGEQMIGPDILDAMLDRTCGERPTVVVISACFSGVFVPALAQPNRMVLTAARPDRTSFGCGEANKYPYFDDCFLSSLPGARDFAGLAGAVKTCVAAREKVENMSPPSEPQLYIGPGLRPTLPLLALHASAPS